MSAISSTEELTSGSTHEGLWSKLTHGRTNYEFVRRWPRWMAISGAVILIGLIALFARGLTLGIDFKGGSLWELPKKNLSVSSARSTAQDILKSTPTVQTLGSDKIRIKGEKSTDVTREKVAVALAKKAGVDRNEVNVTFVGPSWGKDVSKKAQKALVVFFLVIAAYISLRFEYKMAIAALAAVVHDILITVGIYALSGLEVTPATVVAFLTILGYSLYDTIVVFDKVADNEKELGASGKLSYTDVVNLSMNQVLMRSINTSFVAILPILSMLLLGVLVLGATALGDFGLALFIGLLTGAYSSIFVASPLLAILKEREPKWKSLRDKLGARTGVAITPEAASIARAAIGSVGLGAPVTKTGPIFPGQTPRGRKQGKRR